MSATTTSPRAALGLRIVPPALLGARRGQRLVERNLFVYRRTWMILLSGFFEPVFYLASVRLGLGTLVGDVEVDGRTVPYAEFVAPALLATAAMGLTSSPWVLGCLPVAVLIGFAFAAVGLAGCSYARTWADFTWLEAVMVPLFLFSATFYPLSVYSPAAQWIVRATPLYHGVALCRAFSSGQLSWDLLANVAYLVVMGLIGLLVANRRLGVLLLT